MSNIGHNSGTNNESAEMIRQYISRIQRLEEEKKALGADIKDVYGQAKGQGLDPKIIRKVVSALRMDAMEREEQAEIFDLYMAAAGG